MTFKNPNIGERFPRWLVYVEGLYLLYFSIYFVVEIEFAEQSRNELASNQVVRDDVFFWATHTRMHLRLLNNNYVIKIRHSSILLQTIKMVSRNLM